MTGRLTVQSVSALLLVTLPFLFGYGLIDDAYISLRYADNLAAGLGLVFNPGERVEGYSNFLWTILLALGIRIGFDGAAVAIVAGLGTGVVAMLAAGGLQRRHLQDPPDHILAALPIELGIAVSGSFACYIASGLETGLFSVLLLLNARFFLASWERAGLLIPASLCLALASLTRPETPALFLFHLAFLLISAPQDRDSQIRRRLAFFTIPYLAVLIGFLLWRHGYYGYWLPNTYYAKMGGLSLGLIQSGVTYAWTFMLRSGLLAVVLFLATVPAFRRRRENLYLLGFVAAYIAVIVLEGGDHMAQFRFFAPLIPFVIMLYGQAVSHAARLMLTQGDASGLARRIGVSLAVVVISVLASWSIGRSPGLHGMSEHQRAKHEVVLARQWSDFGRWLRHNSDPGDAVALLPIGAISYYSGRPIIDMLGLTDEYIAHLPIETGQGYTGHEKFDNQYVLDRNPRFILAHHIVSSSQRLDERGFSSTAYFPLHQQLLQMPAFHQRYQFRRVHAAPDRYFLFYERRRSS